MHKSNSFKILAIAILVFVLALQSCNKKDEKDKTQKNESSNTSSLVKQDDKGMRADLKIVPKKGEKFRYKMVAKTKSVENSPGTQGKDVTTEQSMAYYYSQEVSEIDESGVITFKMKYDSINISTTISSKDSTLSESFNSNSVDSNASKMDYIQYHALVGSDFKLRVSALGEIIDVYALEKIHDKIFKALGDTLSAKDKESIKESMGADAIKSILQNQYQKFPGNEVYKDSTWSFTNEASILIFPVKNILTYKLKEIQTTDGESIANVEADLGIDFISKEQKEKELTIKITNSKAGGKGTVSFNLSKGCVVKKETNTNINLDMRLSAKGQSALSKQSLETNLIVELLK